MGQHFWVGSLCLIGLSSFPQNVIAVSDVLTILEDMGNHIPDKSWMLYVLELFEKNAAVPIELNLICQFDGNDNFWAIFGGVNRYKFTKVRPAVGHSYLREIVMIREEKAIEYSLRDLDTQENESFRFDISSYQNFSYTGGNHFTGLEWWNKSTDGDSPFLIRYKVQISNLSFCQATSQAALKPATFRPYNVLVPNRDDADEDIGYPVSFENLAFNGNIRYVVSSGKTASGMRHPAY